MLVANFDPWPVAEQCEIDRDSCINGRPPPKPTTARAKPPAATGCYERLVKLLGGPAIVPVPFFLEVHAGTKRGVCQSDGNVSGLSDGASSRLSRTRIFFPVLK